jgi:hypothetical protein
MDEDPLEQHETLDRMETGELTWWGAKAEGGPIDGSAVNVQAVPWLDMRALHLTVAVGPSGSEVDWHYYVFGQRFNEQTKAIEGVFTHVGFLDGEPMVPPGVD